MASVSFAFDADRPAAIRAAERLAAKLVKDVSDETRAALRAMIVRAIREKIPPFEIARVIRSSIGMHSRDAMAALTFREHLVNQGLRSDRVDTLYARYVARKIRERAKTIARTEILGSLNAGVEESFLQARRDGLLGNDAQKEWITTADDITCPICLPLDGQRVPIAESFSTSLGPRKAPPVHPRCRCTLGGVP